MAKKRKPPVQSRMTQLDLPMHVPAVQLPLPLGQDTVSATAPTKAQKRAARVEKEKAKHQRREQRNLERSRPKFLGGTIPQPKTPDGKPIACPCGRIYILQRFGGPGRRVLPGRRFYVVTNVKAGFIFMDKEGPLGEASLGGGYCEPDFKVIVRLLQKHGCKLHEREDERRREKQVKKDPKS